MDGHFGFIRDALDIKILILYILAKLPSPIEPMLLADLATFDDGFTWFDYTDCLSQLEKTGHIVLEDGKYSITPKGRENVSYVGTSLPYSVRAKADRLVAPVAAKMLRASMIETTAEPHPDGTVSVSLRLSDGVGEIISVRLTVPDEEHAAQIAERFRNEAETLCSRIIDILTTPSDSENPK